MAFLHLLNPFKVIEHTAHTVFDVVEYKTHKLLDLAGHKVELVKDVTNYVKEAIDYKAELVNKIVDAKHSYLSDLVEFKYESLLNVLEIKADKLTHVKTELIDLIGKHHDDHSSILDIKESIFDVIKTKTGIALDLADHKVDFIHDLLHIKAHKVADLAELKAKLVADILDIKADKEADVADVVNAEGNEQSQLTVKIASQAGAYNGALLVEITDKDGNVEVVTLTDNYDANVGKTFALDIDNGSTVRVGITAAGSTLWSDNGNIIRVREADKNSATIGIEDDGVSKNSDFDDVVLDITLVGDAAAKLPDNATIGGEIIYPIDVHQDFEDMADLIHGDWEYVEAPEGWFTDNKSGKIEIGFADEYGLKDNEDIVVELETSHHDTPHNLYTMIDSQSDAEVVIEFDYSGRKGHLGIYSDFEVVVDGKVIETIVPDQVGFVSKSITVPGTGDIMRVEFRAINGDSYGAVFSKINVKQIFLNEAPVAEDDTAQGIEDSTLTIAVADLLANDSDPDGDQLFDFSVQDAVNGNVSIVGDTVEFYPDAGYAGPASFTYTITDGKGGFDTATVNLTIEEKVNEAPVVAGEDLDGVEDTAVVTPTAVLLANDVDPEGEALTIISVQDAVNGTVELVNDEVIFTPDADYNGPASYTYTVSDGENEEKATVNLNIAAVNDNPTAGDDLFEGPFIEGQPIAIDVAKVLENDFDIDGDAVRANAVVDSFGGSFAMVDGVPTFIPDAGFVGDATLTYQITDDKGGVDTATITFKIIANPNQDPVANDDNLGQFFNDAPAPIDVAQILSNDTDADGDTLTPTAVVATENGQFAFIDGVPSFVPDAGFVGTASLTYKVEDGKGGSDTATIFFEFVDADQAPQAADDMAEGLSNNDLVIDPADLLANDLDPEGKPLSLVSVGNPVNGTVAIVAGQIIFTPDDGYKGPASFTYVVADPAGNEGSATVNLAINDNAIYGTPNDDIPLNGTESNDYIKGLEGDDTINGLGGDDFIYGGPGKDTIDAGDGDDTVLGGYDDDRIEGGKGNDILNGNQGNDTLKGGDDDDTLNGSSGNDLLLGQEGNDKLYGDAGDDTLEGGAGDDLLQGGQENDVLTGGLGADTFLWTGNDIQPHGNGRETDIIKDFNTAEGDKLDLADLLVNEQNSDNLDRYLDFHYDDSTGNTTIAVSALGSFEKSDDSEDCQQHADQVIVLEGVDLTAGNTIADENIIQNMLNNNQLIVDSL